MQPYKNLGGRSGIASYESGPDFIRVQFSDGDVYTFTYASAGSDNVEHMKELASKGQGLNAFLNRTVRKGYDRKERKSSDHK